MFSVNVCKQLFTTEASEKQGKSVPKLHFWPFLAKIPVMAIQLTPKNLDDIIKLIKKITDALTKSDFLIPEKRQKLEQYKDYEKYSREIENAEKLRMTKMAQIG